MPTYLSINYQQLKFLQRIQKAAIRQGGGKQRGGGREHVSFSGSIYNQPLERFLNH